MTPDSSPRFDEAQEAENTIDTMAKGRHKLTLDNIREINFMRDAGLNLKEISEHFKVSAKIISSSLRRYTDV
jgi:hypothetical protein